MFKIVGTRKIEESVYPVYDIACDDGEIIRDLYSVCLGTGDDCETVIRLVYYRPDDEGNVFESVAYEPTDKLWELFDFMEQIFDEED